MTDEADAVEFLALVVGNRQFAVETGRVAEVVDLPDPTPVPGSHPVVEGVATVRGEVTVVLDARETVSLDGGDRPARAVPGVGGEALDEVEDHSPDQLVAFDRPTDGDRIGLHVDDVAGVQVVPLGDVDRNPAQGRLPDPVRDHPDAVGALLDAGEDTVAVLDVESLAATARPSDRPVQG